MMLSTTQWRGVAVLGAGLLILASGASGWNLAKNTFAETTPPASPEAIRAMGRFYGCVYPSLPKSAPYFVEYTLDSCHGNVCTGHGSTAHAGSFKLTLTVAESRSKGSEALRLDGEYVFDSRPEAHGHVHHILTDGTKLKGNFGSSNSTNDDEVIAGQLLLSRGIPPLDGAKHVHCEQMLSAR